MHTVAACMQFNDGNFANVLQKPSNVNLVLNLNMNYDLKAREGLEKSCLLQCYFKLACYSIDV